MFSVEKKLSGVLIMGAGGLASLLSLVRLIRAGEFEGGLYMFSLILALLAGLGVGVGGFMSFKGMTSLPTSGGGTTPPAPPKA
jgi:hypothetical protein